jgi:lipopolysaccharide/colanic/teichoic acid biosynthesis glycosyltransferase
LNVLVGDMSLVGPRPLPVEPSDFDSVARRRHQVRPGITGPWQVAGGHVLGYDDMIKLDLAYVDSWSLRRDLWYLAMTMPTVMVRRSAY